MTSYVYRYLLKMAKIKVFMVDDHEFILVMAKQYLETSGIEVVGTAGTYEDALKNAFENSPDVLIIDLNLGGLSGIDLIRELKLIKPDAKILVFSARSALPAIASAYKVGAMGYLMKATDPAEIIRAVTKVSAGEIYYMPGYAEKILNYQSTGNDPDPRSMLSKREFEIFLDIAKNYSNEVIAARYDINVRSISNRISDIRKKLNNYDESFAIIANRHGISFLQE